MNKQEKANAVWLLRCLMSEHKVVCTMKNSCPTQDQVEEVISTINASH